MQRVAVLYPRDTASRCNTLQHTATRCNTLEHSTIPQVESAAAKRMYGVASACTVLLKRHCYTLQHTITPCNTLIYIRSCNKNVWCCIRMYSTIKETLPHTATHFDTLQHTTPLQVISTAATRMYGVASACTVL